MSSHRRQRGVYPRRTVELTVPLVSVHNASVSSSLGITSRHLLNATDSATRDNGTLQLGTATYHAAKHGVLGLTKSAALEYAARGIRINAVCPGLIWTPMADQMVAAGQGEALEAMVKSVPMGRYGRAEEIADAVLWLCSGAASYVTGQSISVDGGFIMR